MLLPCARVGGQIAIFWGVYSSQPDSPVSARLLDITHVDKDLSQVLDGADWRPMSPDPRK